MNRELKLHTGRMKKVSSLTMFVALAAALASPGPAAAQPPALEWAVGMGSTASDYADDLAMDSAGNVYTNGTFRLTVDFDPGAGTANLTANGDSDIFVQKLDSTGALVWAAGMGGTGGDEGFGFAFD